MDKVLYNVVFNRKKRLLRNGKALIQIEAYLRGKKKYFSTNIYILPDQWDKKHRSIKNHPNSISLNKQIKDYVNSLEEIEMNRRQSGKPFTLQFLTDFLKGKFTTYFIEFCKKQIESDKKLRLSTKQQHNATLKHLEDFRKNLTFEQLNFEFLTEFDDYLRKKGLHQNTIIKLMGVIRRYVNRAIDLDMFDLNKYPFRKFEMKQKQGKRDFLTPEELERIESLVLSNENEKYQLALDKFLFAAYTGLRYSDMSALRPESLVLVDGNEWLTLEMVKTNDPIRIPIYLLFDGKALDIIYKYIGKSKHSVFPYQKNETINTHLKTIAQLAEINKNVTYHVARHTQATYLLYKGVSITTLQKLLGHKRLETTQIYGKVMDMTIVKELQNVSFSR